MGSEAEPRDGGGRDWGFDPGPEVDRATMPPAWWYTDPEVLALERARIFASAWYPAAPLAAVERPGEYVSGEADGLRWLLVRGADGALRAFHNVCRHKAAPVADGAGCAEGFTCPYHGWRYALDGALRSAPRLGPARGFDAAEHALLPLGVQPWGPLVWVNRDPSAPRPCELFPEVHHRLEATGWERLVHVARRTYPMRCNWKVFVDNYLDGGYHIPVLHPSLHAQLDLDGYRTERFARSSIQSSPAAAEATQLDVSRGAGADGGLRIDTHARLGEGAIYAWLFPHLALNRYGPALDTNWIIPRGPDRTDVVYDFFFDPAVLQRGDDAPGDFARASILASELTQIEDGAICERVQGGLASGGYRPGRYAPALEASEHQFHRLLHAALASAPASF